MPLGLFQCLQLFPGITLGIGMLFIPFSPGWLIHHDREKEARHVLSSLRNISEDNDLIELEFLDIKAQYVFEKRQTARNWPHLSKMSPLNTFKLQWVAIGSLFRTHAMFRRVICATVTTFFQQATRINACKVSPILLAINLQNWPAWSAVPCTFDFQHPGHLKQHN